jgi:hypothetical protein
MNCLVILYSCYLVGVKDSVRAYGIIMLFRGVGYFLGIHASGITFLLKIFSSNLKLKFINMCF